MNLKSSYLLRRSLDICGISNFLDRGTPIDRMLLVSGEPGVGKTSWVHESLNSWIRSNDVAISFSNRKLLRGYDELGYLILDSARGTSDLPRLERLTKHISNLKQLNLFEYCSRSSRKSYLDDREIIEAFLEDTSNAEFIWLVLDHGAMRDEYVNNWVHHLLGSKKRSSNLKVVAIFDNPTELDVDKIDLPYEAVIVNPLTNDEVRELYQKLANSNNALSILGIDETIQLTQNNTLWLQWLANCPRSWFRKGDETPLDKGFLKSLLDTEKANFFAYLGLCEQFSQKTLEAISSLASTGDDDVAWILNTPLLELLPGHLYRLHYHLRTIITSEINENCAPLSEVQYNSNLRGLFFDELYKLTANSALSSNKASLLTALENNLIHGKLGDKISSDVKNVLDEAVVEVTSEAPSMLHDFALIIQGRIGNSLEILWSSIRDRSFQNLSSQWRDYFHDSNFGKADRQSRFSAILGFFYYLDDKYTEARNCFDMAITINSHDFIAYFGKGLVQQDKHNWESAIQEFSRSINNNSRFASAYSERGSAYFSLGQISQAIKDYQATIRINSKSIQALVNLGIIYYQLGELEQANRWFQAALISDPEEARAYLALVSRIKLGKTVMLQ